MAKKLLCLLLVLTLALSASMVSFAVPCGEWGNGVYTFAYCATPICAGEDIPTAYGHVVYEMRACNGEEYVRKVVVARGCCNP